MKNIAFALVRALSLISLVFSIPVSSIAGETRWVFPNEQIPGDTIIPMTIGEGSDFDLQVKELDWYMLKNSLSTLTRRAEIANEDGVGLNGVDYWGPRLNEFNAQRYYRLITGLILQESLIKATGLSQVEARSFYNRASSLGLNFDTSPLSEFGSLPGQMSFLFENLEKKTILSSLIPDIIAPLAIAYHSTKLRHFYEGFDNVRQCNNIYDLKPVSLNWETINLRQEEYDKLEAEIEEKKSILEQVKIEKDQASQALQYSTSQLGFFSGCFNQFNQSVESRVESIDLNCRERSVLNINSSTELNVNITTPMNTFFQAIESYPEGLFLAYNNNISDISLLELAIGYKKQGIESIEGSKTELEAEVELNNSNLASLAQLFSEKENSLEALQIKRALLAQELEKLNNEKIELLTRSVEERGELSEETQLLTEQIPESELRVSAILAEITEIDSLSASYNTDLQALEIQIAYLENRNKDLSLQISSITDQTFNLVEKSIEELEAELSVEKDESILLAKYRNSALVVLNSMSSFIELLETDLEEKTNEFSLRSTRVTDLEAELIALEESFETTGPAVLEGFQTALQEVENYIGENGALSWFLEKDCKTQELSNEAPLFISRNKFSDDYQITESPVSKWGLFNINLKNYKNTIASGDLLNLKKHISHAVSVISDHLNYSNSFLIGDSANCINNSPINSIVSSFSMWNESSDSDESNEGFCQIQTQEAKEFRDSLFELINFEDSLLNAVLPQAQYSSVEFLVEREALEAISSAFKNLLAEDDSNIDKEGFIKAIIKVIANDYNEEIQKGSQGRDDGYTIKLADEAPGAELYKEVNLEIGETYEIKTLGQVDLYSSPLDNSESLTGEFLSFGDEVKVVQIDEENSSSVRSNWVKVEVLSLNNQSYWMPAWSLTYKDMVNSQGESVQLIDSNACPLNQLVEEVTNFDNNDPIVTRFLKEIELVEEVELNYWKFDWTKNKENRIAKTGPTRAGITHIACDVFYVDGLNAIGETISQEYESYAGVNNKLALGISIVEAKLVEDAKGRSYYLPIENRYDGYVPVWLHGKNSQRPRIILGEKLNSNGQVIY